MPVYAPLIGTDLNNNYSFSSFSTSPPVSGSVYTIDGAGGTDTFVFGKGVTYLNRYLSTNFTIAPADASGVIVVTGASVGGTRLTFNLKSVEQLVFGDGTVQLLYPAPDTTAPVFSSATVNGSTLVLSYTDANNLDAAHAPAVGAFSVSNHSVSAVAVDGAARTVTLTLGSAVSNGEAVTVAYTDPTSGNDLNAIQDLAGNDAATLAATPVTNTTPVPPDTTASTDSESDNHVDHSTDVNHDYSSNHIIFGNSRDNILDGRGGNYTMQGGAGNDTYIVDSVGDVVKELAHQGVDTVKASVTFTLGANVENLTLTGHDAINGTGNELDNIITGNSGNNILSGGAGHDVLTGGDGSDILTGGSGADYFVFNVKPNASSNLDTVTDFQPGADELQFSKAIFTALGSKTGELSGDKFWSGATAVSAHDSTDRIIYNTTTGALYYDADGIGGAAAVQVAIIGTVAHPDLHASDIHIIA